MSSDPLFGTLLAIGFIYIIAKAGPPAWKASAVFVGALITIGLLTENPLWWALPLLFSPLIIAPMTDWFCSDADSDNEQEPKH